VRFDKLFLKTIRQDLKITIYKDKTKILTLVNEQIAKVGFAKQIKDIIFK
jgi:hypothetical protein